MIYASTNHLGNRPVLDRYAIPMVVTTSTSPPTMLFAERSSFIATSQPFLTQACWVYAQSRISAHN